MSTTDEGAGGPRAGQHQAGQQGGEPLGSVADEAAKLLEALQGWAREGGGEAAAGLGARLKDFETHLGPTGEPCTWCPLCQTVALVRQTSPEVRTHLATAASSLLQAAAGLLDAHAASSAPRASGVEKIDLDEDPEWPEDGTGWDAD